MNDKYTRASDSLQGTAIGCGFFLIILILIAICSAIKTVEAFAAGILVFFILMIVVAFIDIDIREVNFEADDTAVTFSCLGRKKVIRYEDIINIKLERRNDEFESRGGMVRDYIETLTITTKEKTHVFSAKMDINYDIVALDPDDLKKQFENSKFSQLKHYIEGHLPILNIE